MTHAEKAAELFAKAERPVIISGRGVVDTDCQNIVAEIADNVAVMYMGRVVEFGTIEQVFTKPLHPYTKALLSAVPSLQKNSSRIILKGDVPSPLDPPRGCPFHPRCPFAKEICKVQKPELKNMGSRAVACFLAD